MQLIRLAVRCLAVAATGTLLGAGTASATTLLTVHAPDQLRPTAPGMYHVWSCRTPAGATATLDGWVDVPKSSCSAPGGSFGFAYGTGNPPTVPGGAFSWGSAADLEPISMELWRTATVRSERETLHGGAAANAGAMRPNAATGTADLQAYDELSSTTQPGGTVGVPGDPKASVNLVRIDPLSLSLPSGTNPVSVNGRCWGWDGTFDCLTSYSIFAADVRLRDARAPTFANLTGPLSAALTAGTQPQVGTLAFTIGAADRGSGVLRAVIEVDGKAEATVSAAPSSPICSPTPAADGLRGYIVQVPCPLAATISGSWDTRGAANGLRNVRLLIEDAAGNATVAASGNVLVDNPVASPIPSPPPPPNGDVPDGGSRGSLTLTWPSTAKKATATPSVVKRCKGAAYAKNHPVDCAGRPAQAELLSRWSDKASDELQARLTTPGGAPIAGARLQLFAHADAVGAGDVALDALVTGADGTATVAIGRNAGSRRLTARWFAASSDLVAGAEASASLAVAASTSFKAPKRVRPSARVKFSGQLRGPGGTLGKVPLTLQVRNQGQWKTFETATSDVAGRWSVGLRFAPRRGSYPVRVKVGTSPTFPFAEGLSAETSVRVS